MSSAKAVFGVLGDRNVLPYLAGNLMAATGMWFQLLAQSVLLYRLTGSEFLLGVLSFSQFVGVFLLAPWAGSFADRYDRRIVLALSESWAFIVTLALAITTGLGYITTELLLAFAVLFGIRSAFSTPAMMALVPTLVQRRYFATALALNSVTFNIGRAVGPVLAAVVITTAGITWALSIAAFMYLPLAIGALCVHPLAPRVAPETQPRFRESLLLVLRDRHLATLLYVIAAVNLCTDPIVTLGPAYITSALGEEDVLAGLLIGGFGAGAIIAAFTVSPRLDGTRLAIAATLALATLGTLAFALAQTLTFALLALALLGFGYLATNVSATARLQLDVSESQRGRMMAIWMIAFLGVRPIGSLVDGLIASVAGVRVAAVVMALPAAAGVIILLMIRRQGAS